MTDDTILPIAERPSAPSKPSGRQADLIAMCVAGLGVVVSLIAALWFFLGFAENDTRPEHLVSAFVLTTLLFSFSILPFAIVAEFTRRAFRVGARRVHLFWSLFLMLPWIGLGLIAATHTPLPIWVGGLMAGLAAVLSLWAFVSLILDWRHAPRRNNTAVSHENEVT